MNKPPKKLKLMHAQLGGLPHFCATNYQLHGDYATVAYYVGNPQTNNEIFIEMTKEFNTPDYLAQVKEAILAKNPNVVFADEQEGGNFIQVEQVIKVAQEHYKLMSFEVDMIQKNPSKLHQIYLMAKPEKLDQLPRQYDYEAQNNLYPLYQVFDSVTRLIHG